MANTTIKNKLVETGAGLLKQYQQLANGISQFKMYWEAVDGSGEIDNADNLADYGYPGATGAEFKTAMANLLSVLTTYDGGVDTNIHKVIG